MADGDEARREPMPDMDNKVVRYVGTSNVRQITTRDWRGAIGRDHPTVTWYREAPLNQVKVSTFDLDPEEFHRCIVMDQDLRVVDLVAERSAG